METFALVLDPFGSSDRGVGELSPRHAELAVAGRFYGADKLARSAERFRPDRRAARLQQRFFDAIGGRPSEAVPDRTPER